MTCTLYLVRHAVAERVSASGRDADRELTPEGIEKLRQEAHGLSWLGIVPTEIRSSPLVRARQTAAMLGAVLVPKVPVTPCPELAPGHAPDAVIAALAQGAASGLRAIMLVAHEPDLGRLASYVMTGSPDTAPLPFKKGAVAAIELPSLVPRSLGRLQWFSTPKQLRALGELVTRPRPSPP
jgi:phosphohistidine phosphatase